MRTSRTFLTVALAATAGLALFGGAVATAQEDDAAPVEASASTPEALIADLAELEVMLAGAGDLSVEVAADATSVSQGGRLTGDFVGASVLYESVHDRVLNLYVSADESPGPVAAAVADAARSILLAEESLQKLAEFEDYDLGRALGSVDTQSVATGADPALGLLEGALAAYESSQVRAFGAYDVLQNAPEAASAEQDLFALRRDEVGRFLDDTLADIRAYLGRPTTAVLSYSSRFEGANGEARARSLQYVCIDRNLYEIADPDTNTLPDDAEFMLYGSPLEAGDCPDLPDENTRVVVSSP